MNKKFWAATFTLTGTIIGAGILGLPYVFAKSGFLVGAFWVIVLGIILMTTKLYLGEVCLRTKKTKQLTGLAEKYLGKFAGKLMLFAMAFGIYSALIAYLIGEGESFSQLIFGTTGYAFYLAIIFWVVMTFLLQRGIEGLKKIETWGVVAVILIVAGILIYFFPQVQMQNLFTFNFKEFLFPIGVITFAFLGFTSIPELEMIFQSEKDKKFLKKSIVVGVLIPIIIYLVFPMVFVGIIDGEILEVATLSFGPIVALLGIFTMLTSYFILSFSLRDTFKYDLKTSKLKTFFWVSVFPIAVYILIHLIKMDSFVNLLGVGGVVSGGLTGILILLMNRKAKMKSDKKPQYEIPINWFIIALFSLVFILGVVGELMF